MKKFKPGDVVIVTNKKDKECGELFRIRDAEPLHSPWYLVVKIGDTKDTVYKEDELAFPNIDFFSGSQLDHLATKIGMSGRGELWDPSLSNIVREADDLFRNRIMRFCGMRGLDPHAGHEVIENYAGGKTFYYCRDCKVEANKPEGTPNGLA